MIQTECKVECGVAIPGAFGIEYHRSTRTDQNILRTHVAVNEREFRARRLRAECLQARRDIRLIARRFEQIGLESQLLEICVIGKLRGEPRISRGGGMQAAESIAEGAGESRIHFART